MTSQVALTSVLDVSGQDSSNEKMAEESFAVPTHRARPPFAFPAALNPGS
jgi:hypothetical protein